MRTQPTFAPATLTRVNARRKALGLLAKSRTPVRKNRVPVIDRKELQFPSVDAAIGHGEEFARRLRAEGRLNDPELQVVVLDDSGMAIHREPVYPDDQDGHGTDRMADRTLSGRACQS